VSNFSSSSSQSTIACSRLSVPRTFAATVQVVDRRPVGQVREVHLQPVAEMPDVVERAARVGPDERVDGRAELDQGVREMRAHEAVGSGDENGAALVDVSELTAKIVD
jgi:hypothetical protein